MNMRNKYTRRNNILSALTGAAIGLILTGINVLNWTGLYQLPVYKIVSVVMITVGSIWLVLFTYVNRKVLFRFN
jgi:hypothetical protein